MQSKQAMAAQAAAPTSERTVKIGLEIHGYLAVESKAKLFCDCAIEPDAEANTTICPICTGQPGSKPMPANKQAIDKIIALAAMLDCSINNRLIFQRKHYSWPDMPTGYQRTMSGSYAAPVGEHGSFLGIGIEEVHLEEDPARWDPETGQVDYNRSGYPLVEIVTKPDFTSSEQVRVWLRRLLATLSYIKAINPDLGIKSDVNVSVSPAFDRVEVKNVNSLRSIVRAIDYEIARQRREIAEGKKVGGETRAWRDADGMSVFMRHKETALDYLFIPDPDLPAIRLTPADITTIRSTLPETPSVKIKKYIGAWKLNPTDAEILSSEIVLAQLFETITATVTPLFAAKWLRRELLRVLNYQKQELEDVQVDAVQLAALLHLVEQRTITDETGKKLLEQLIEKPFDVRNFVEEHNLFAVAESSLLEQYCKDALAENQKAVADYKSGNEKALNFIVGSVMRKSKGTATPQQVQDILKRMIG